MRAAMTLTTTPTREALSRSRIALALCPDGGRARVVVGADGPTDRPVIRPVLLSSDEGGARVSLVPEGALLLAGDHISIDIEVGAGARLELIEPAGTVAYAMDGGRASWDVTIRLAAGARLLWAGEPFVVAQGASVDRCTSVQLGAGAVLALREMLVLGRTGEQAGDLRQRLDVTGPDGAPILVEDLDICSSSGRLLLGGARTVGTVMLVGARLAEPSSEGTRLDLESPGTLVRCLSDQAHLATTPGAWAEATQVARAI